MMSDQEKWTLTSRVDRESFLPTHDRQLCRKLITGTTLVRASARSSTDHHCIMADTSSSVLASSTRLRCIYVCVFINDIIHGFAY